ncbi:MAG TPA: glyoxylate/hydroxypyruvate reductase A [Rhizobiaceae bacterium]|nr:glyoxylate/hydroxypyruvate reductase A [Rhizobiaceae bacterium]
MWAGTNAGRVLLSVRGFDPAQWRELLSRQRTVVTELDDPADPSIHYAVVWKQPSGILARLPNLRAIFSVGAGVDHLFADPDLPDVPIVRVVDDNLTGHMVEYVAWRVLDHHRQGMTYRANQAAALWFDMPQPRADEVAVGFLGFGNLAKAAVAALRPFGFQLNGWSRSPSAMEGVRCFDGPGGLGPFLAATDILVVLLPLTDATRGMVDHGLLGGLRRGNALGGPVLINAGRGGLQNEADILRALEDGTLKEASLDVFESEPLPTLSPLWPHHQVFVTPHAAAVSDPAHLVPSMLAQMDAHDGGAPLRNLVDRAAGY